MKKILLLFGLVISLYAKMDDYTLQKQSFAQEKFFIKYAAFLDVDNARKAQLTTDFATQIIYMKTYHSIISREFKSEREAKEALQKIKKEFDDAYIFKLYKKPKTKKPLPIKHIKKTTLYDQAIIFYNDRKYEEALMAFDRILIETPENIDAKIYYAKTLYEVKLFTEAKKEFTLLLNEPLSTQNKKEIKQYLRSIDKNQKRHFFNTTLSIGVGHDDNINLTTDTQITQYGPYTLINDTNKTSSAYGLASLALTHRYIANGFDLYSSLYSYNEFAHSKSGNDLNFIDISSAIIKQYKKFSIIMPVGFNTSYLDGDNIGHNLYTNPSITYNINRQLKTFVQASFIDNKTKFAENRDYTAVAGGLGIRYSKKKFKGLFGVNIQKYKSKEDLRYDINKETIGFMMHGNYYLFTNLYIGSNFSFTTGKYSDLDEVMGYKRNDDILRYGLSLGFTIYKNMLVHLKYQYSKNNSNVNAYAYKKNNYTLEYKYKF